MENDKNNEDMLKSEKTLGEFYTPKLLAEFVAQQIVNHYITHGNNDIQVLDPAVGDGELLIALRQELANNGFKRVSLHGFDVSPEAVNSACAKLKNSKNCTNVSILEQDFLKFIENDNLFDKKPINQKYDIIISNPPYVRTQILGSSRSREISKIFNLTGRVDLYHVFIEGIARSLKPGGIAGIIVSNRFMTTKSGAFIRERIFQEFEIIHVWDFGDTRLFKAAVLPCVMLLRKKDKEVVTNTTAYFTSTYTTNKVVSSGNAKNVFEVIENNGVYAIDGQNYQITQGILHANTDDGTWRIKTNHSEDWLGIVKSNTWCTFGDIGKIRVGVKTTADKIFIRSDWNNSSKKPELLSKLITHHQSRRFKALELNDIEILYPYESIEGKRVLMDIKKYPATEAYLLENEEKLKSRKYIIESSREWFEIWVPHNPTLWKKPKIVFRDISEKPTFWMDLDKSIINGDCYWMTCEKNNQEDLLWLALATANSRFIEKFYDTKFNNKLYSGRRRFMTQYVEQFPIPNPNNSDAKIIVQLAKNIYNEISQNKDTGKLEKELDKKIWKVFGLEKEISG